MSLLSTAAVRSRHATVPALIALTGIIKTSRRCWRHVVYPRCSPSPSTRASSGSYVRFSVTPSPSYACTTHTRSFPSRYPKVSAVGPLRYSLATFPNLNRIRYRSTESWAFLFGWKVAKRFCDNHPGLKTRVWISSQLRDMEGQTIEKIHPGGT